MAYNWGVLRQLWKTAFDSTCLTQNFGQVAPGVAGRSNEMPIPNLNSDVIAIELQMHLILSSVAGQAQVANSIMTDIIDNFIIKDPEGKTVIDVDWESFYNYCGMFNGGNVGDIDALAAIGAKDTHTYDARIIIPVFIPSTQGIHKMVFDYNLPNIYGGDVTLDNGSYISFSVLTNDGANLEKWKATDRTQNIMAGNNKIDNFETDRNWYALFIQHVTAGVTDIDDVKMTHMNYTLIDDEYDDLHADSEARIDEIDFAIRWAGDTILSFRNHVHLSTDNLMIEGTQASRTVLLLIGSADASRPVVTPEVTSRAVVGSVSVTPAVSQMPNQQPILYTNPATGGNSILPVKVNVNY